MNSLLMIYICGVLAAIIAKVFALNFTIQYTKILGKHDEYKELDFLEILDYFWTVIFSWLCFGFALCLSYIEFKNYKKALNEANRDS